MQELISPPVQRMLPYSANTRFLSWRVRCKFAHRFSASTPIKICEINGLTGFYPGGHEGVGDG